MTVLNDWEYRMACLTLARAVVVASSKGQPGRRCQAPRPARLRRRAVASSTRSCGPPHLDPVGFVFPGMPCSPGRTGRVHRDRRGQSRERLRLLARAASGTRRAKLFVSSADDVYGARGCGGRMARVGERAEAARDLPGAQHGTDMLRKGEPTARPLVKLVLRFLMRTVPPSGEESR
jgi:hypothetical protein